MRIGLLGGTFDPIHQGHLYIAAVAKRLFDLDRVEFLVARVPPHKRSGSLMPEWHRFAMVALATFDQPGFRACDFELSKQGPSYTVETLDALRRLHPENEYCFVGGGDSLKEIHLWRECGRLLRENCFVFVRRPGTEADVTGLEISDSLRNRIQVVCETEKPSIQLGKSYLVLADPPPVSSTAVRECLAAGRTPGPELVPPRVLAHIQKYRLYEQ